MATGACPLGKNRPSLSCGKRGLGCGPITAQAWPLEDTRGVASRLALQGGRVALSLRMLAGSRGGVSFSPTLFASLAMAAQHGGALGVL